VISYFSTRDWKITNKNVQELWQKMDEDDRKLFDFNIDGLDWDKYFYTYVRGIRLYLLKDDMSTIPQATARYKRYVECFGLRKHYIRSKDCGV
jgi:Male sterility protein.